MSAPRTQLSRSALVALVVGSMIGAGIFTLPAAFARSTGVVGAIVAWCIAGSGMLMLAFVFQTLSRRKPELDAGIYAYAKAGFGNYMGFTAAFGYWVACCLAQVALLVLIKAALGQFFPAFGDGTTLVAIAAASAMVWGVHVLILRGVKQAMALNTIATIAKLVPIAIFVVFVIAGFNADIFALNLWGREETSFTSVASQVRNTILVTVFVFVGMEGASVYSRYAKDRNDAGFATILGFLGVLFLDVARCGRRAGLPQGVVICGSQESERRHQGAGRYAGDDLENRALARLRRAIQESRPEGAVRASSVQTRPA